MKRMKRILRLGSAMAAALALGACSQDETAAGGSAVPMELTATGLQPVESPMTRATVDGNWEGVDKVAVLVESDVRVYKVTPTDNDKTTAKLEPDGDYNTLYWPESGSATVSAWWPYNNANLATMPDVEVEKDQSGDGFAQSDYIEAVSQQLTPTDNALTFKHRTAKIRVVLKDAAGSELTGAVVALDMDGTTVVEKCHAGAAANEHVALIAPNKYGGVLKVRIAADGKNYVYEHTTRTAYEENNQYTFNLTVKGDEAVMLDGCTISGWTETTLVENGTAEEAGYTIDDDGTYHVTNAAGLTVWAEAVAASKNKDVFCELEADIEMPAVNEGESNWTPVCGKEGGRFEPYVGTFDGNGHTIKGLRIKQTEGDNGFFCCVGGTVKNLTLDDAEVTGSNVAGAVAAYNYGEIFHCYVTNSKIKSQYAYAGGIAGSMANIVGLVPVSRKISFCVVSDCELGAGTGIGGIAGINNGFQIIGCYANACSFEGEGELGGIVGNSFKDDASYLACYSSHCTFNQLGTEKKPGGFAGRIDNDPQLINSCYWNSENVTDGVGQGGYCPGIKKVTTWDNTTMSTMNTALGTGAEYKFAENTDGNSSEPYILE